MPDAYQARHQRAGSYVSRHGSVAPRKGARAAAGLLSIPAIAFATPAVAVAGSILMADSAFAATAVDVTNLQAELVSPASGSTIGYTDTITVQWSFDVPASAASGDTTTFTVPNYISGAVSNLAVNDASGATIGTLSGSGQTFVLTYSSYVDTHDNVTGQIRTGFGVRTDRWASGVTNDIYVAQGASQEVAGQITLVYTSSNYYTESTTIGQQNNTPQNDLFYTYSSPTFTAADDGVTQLTTFAINPESQAAVKFNCDVIDRPTGGIVYNWGATRDVAKPYNAASSTDPLQMEVVGCTDTTVTVTYVAQAGTGFGLRLTQNIADGDAMRLTPDAILSQNTGPFRVTTTRTPQNGSGVPTSSSASYSFTSAGGSGNVTPTAQLQAYVADKTPADPTGQTSDGQNSDADTAPGVSVVPGTTKVSLAVKNTGSVPLTGGVIKDADTGATVGTVGFIDAGDTVVVQIDVNVPQGTTVTKNYTAEMQGQNSAAAPTSDPINVTGKVLTPDAANDSVTTPYNTQALIDVLANDAPGNPAYPLVPSTLVLVDGGSTTTGPVFVDGGTFYISGGKVAFRPNPGFVGNAGTVTYQVADGLGNTTTATVSVKVAGVDSTSNDDSATTTFNTPVTIDVLANDVAGASGVTFVPGSLTLLNASGNPASSVAVTGGTYTVSGGRVVFTPSANFTGNAGTVHYRVTNSTGTTSSATVSVSVTGVSPTIVNDMASTDYGTPVTVDVLANDNGGAPGVTIDASTLTLLNASGNPVSSVTVAGGTYSISGGKVVFTPAAGFSGPAPAVTYRVANSLGTTGTGTVMVTVSYAPPTAANDTATTPYESPVLINVLGNDKPGSVNAPLDPSTLKLVDSNGNLVTELSVNGGKYSVVNGQILFTPAARFVGTAATVTYQVSDAAGHSATAKVTATVENVHPQARPDVATTSWLCPVSVDVLANDIPGAADAPFVPSTLTLIDSSGRAVSSISTSAGTYKVSNGKIVFTPSCWFMYGTAPKVTYQVTDVLGNTVQSTVQVSVGGCAPYARDDSETTYKNQAVTVDVLRNDGGGSWGSLVSSTLMLVDANGQRVSELHVTGGTYKVVSGKVVFTPDSNFVGTAAAVTYEVADQAGNYVSARVQVQVKDTSSGGCYDPCPKPPYPYC